MGIVVAVNALMMGIEYQMNDRDAEEWEYRFMIFDLMFLTVFTIELAMRLSVLGLKKSLQTPAMLLDILIVTVGLVTEVLLPLYYGTFLQPSNSQANENFQIIKVLKTLRALRAIRVLRMLTMFGDLWRIVQMFFFSLKPLLTTVFFIIIIIFLFAMFSIVLIGRTDIGEGDPEAEKQRNRFRTTSEAMLALMQIMTLDDWAKITMPLMRAEYWLYAWFLMYISVSALSLMNMVT